MLGGDDDSLLRQRSATNTLHGVLQPAGPAIGVQGAGDACGVALEVDDGLQAAAGLLRAQPRIRWGLHGHLGHGVLVGSAGVVQVAVELLVRREDEHVGVVHLYFLAVDVGALESAAV